MNWTPEIPKILLVHSLLFSQKRALQIYSKAFFEGFKLIFHQIQNFYDKSHFLLHLSNFG